MFSVSLCLPLSFMLTHVRFSVCGTRGEPATFGSLGIVLIMGLEAAIRPKVICQEVQSPDWDSPLGIV